MPQEWVDYLLIRELYHCTPSELDAQDDRVVETHIGFMAVQADQQHFENMRQKQRARANKKR